MEKWKSGKVDVFVTGGTGYIEFRIEGAGAIARAGLTATVLRPWYVMGPGHRWPMLLLPIYGALELWPATRERAQRLGLVTIDQMVAALMEAVERPPATGTARVVGVPDIRRSQRPTRSVSG